MQRKLYFVFKEKCKNTKKETNELSTRKFASHGRQDEKMKRSQDNSTKRYKNHNRRYVAK